MSVILILLPYSVPPISIFLQMSPLLHNDADLANATYIANHQFVTFCNECKALGHSKRESASANAFVVSI